MQRQVIAVWALAVLFSLSPARAAGEPASQRMIGRLALSRSVQVRQGMHHWQGSSDASLALEIQQRDETLILRGTWYDDAAFLQPYPVTAPSANAPVEYAADGWRIILRSSAKAGAATRLDAYFDFDSQATHPKVKVIHSEKGAIRRLSGTGIKLARRHGEIQFHIEIPLAQLLNSPLKPEGETLEIRLYDLDGEPNDFTLLSERITLESQSQGGR